MALTILLGGARSGKSTLATSMARSAGPDVFYLATAEARDEEMTARIEAHRDERPQTWTTVEEPLEIERSLLTIPDEAPVILDCLTMWVSNLIEQGLSDEGIIERAGSAAAVAAARSGLTVAISNEVGSGIVPLNGLARRYRDLLGKVNARWSTRADDAYLVVAGRALALTHASELMNGSRDV